MKRLSAVLLVLLTATLARATTARVEHPGSLVLLLGIERVQKDLKVDSLQAAVLDSLRQEYKAAARSLTQPLPQTPKERSAAEKKLLALNARYNQRALSTLSDTQRVRLLEVEHQILGPTKLISPGVQKKLGLNEKQAKSIEALRQKGLAYVGQVNRQFEEGKIGYFERIEMLRAKRVSLGKSMLKVLTPEQQKSLLSMSGRKLAS